MPRKAQKPQGIAALIEGYQPFITIIVMVAGVIVWTFNTFAQISSVEKIYAEIKANQELLKADSRSYSDSNREKNYIVVLDLKEGLREVKEQVRSLESRLLQPLQAVRP